MAQVKTQDAMIMISRCMDNFKDSANTADTVEFENCSGYANEYISHLVELGLVEESFTNGVVSIDREDMAELVYSMYFY